MSGDPMSDLIHKARDKASRTSGQPTIVHAKDCLCEVEVAFFSPPKTKIAEAGYSSPGSTRERYSRCVDHALT